MTDKAKALVERLRDDWPEILVEKHWMMDSDAIDKQREEAADLIETQAREIERLREALQDSARALDASNVLIHALSGAPSVMVETFAERTRAALAGDSHDQ